MDTFPLIRTALLCLPLTLSAQSAYDIALIGDMPYGPANEPRFERVIADINHQNVEFTAHIGDTKSGSTRCDDSHYSKTLNYFNTFDKPLIYSIGDNEWTDCMRTNNGAYDPLGRLDLVRKTYFSTPMSLGRRPIALMRQSEVDSRYSKFVENTMLVKAPVVFAAIHMPGSNNNLEYKTVQGAANPFYDNDREFAERNQANIAWMRRAFQTARDTRSLGLMFFVQANIFETFMDTSTGATHSGFAEFVSVLRDETRKFSGEVVIVSGDSHYMRIDKPLTDQYPACTSPQGDCKPFDAALDARGNTVLNFTRAEVPGSANVDWMICHIRPSERNLFQFEFMIVPDLSVPATGVTAVITSQGGTAASDGTLETVTGQLTLSAVRSTSSNSGDLTYAWAPSQQSASAAVVGLNSPNATVQLSIKGTYQFTLTVTDRTGEEGTATLTIRYI